MPGRVGLEDAAGAPGSKVVVGGRLAVAAVQHQLVAILLRLEA